ncbi:MAG: hypothetical protein QM594_19960 [Niabella sp.]
MRYFLVVFLIITSSCSYVYAQDTLYLVNGRKVAVEIVEIKRGMVKFLLPGKKNFRRLPLHVVDSAKDEAGVKDEKVEAVREKRLYEKAYRKQNIELKKEAYRANYTARKIRNSFIDPYPNRVSAGVQAISTSLILAKILDRHADISAAMGTNATYEKTVLQNRLGLAASVYWSWNKTAQGLLLTSKYYVLNRQTFRLGIGPMFAYSYVEHRPKPSAYTNYTTVYAELIPVSTAPVVAPKVYASTFGVNFGTQVDLNKQMFISNDVYIGGTDYKGISSEKAFLSYKLNIGFKF